MTINPSIENTSSAKGGIGDLTVGDITETIGKSGSLDNYINNSAYNAAGDLTVGNISLTLGENAYGSMEIYNSAYNYSAGDDVTVGNTTVGDITVAVAKSASMETLSVEAYAYANTGSASVGYFP